MSATLTRETARPGTSLALIGGLPPVRTESGGRKPVGGLQAATPSRLGGPDFLAGGADLMPGLSNYLRPQSAFQWWTLPYLSQITPQYVQQILIGGLAGMHVACWQMFDLMLDTNPEIRACVGEWVDGITSKKLIIEPYHEEDMPPTDTAVRNAKIVSAALRNMVKDPCADENNLRETIRDIVFARFHGQSVLEIDYYEADDPAKLHTLDVPNIGTIIAPRSTFWCHPVTYAWDVTGRMGLRIPGDNLKEITRSARKWAPGTLPTDYGLANGLTFTGYTGSPRVQSVTRFPANQFLISVIKGKTGAALGASDLRPLAGWWVYENFCTDFAMDLAQVFGIPFRVATFSANTSEPDKAFVREMLQNMGSRGWALLPEGVTLSFEKAMASGAETPQGFLIKLCQEQYRKVILRQTMTGSGHGGAASGSKGGMDTESDVKEQCIQSGADYGSDVLREQFARSILRLNVGSDQETPFVRLANERDGTLEEMQRDQIGAQIIDIGENYFRRKYNYPKLAPGEKVAGKEPVSQPAATDQDPDQSGKPGNGQGNNVQGDSTQRRKGAKAQEAELNASNDSHQPPGSGIGGQFAPKDGGNDSTAAANHDKLKRQDEHDHSAALEHGERHASGGRESEIRRALHTGASEGTDGSAALGRPNSPELQREAQRQQSAIDQIHASGAQVIEPHPERRITDPATHKEHYVELSEDGDRVIKHTRGETFGSTPTGKVLPDGSPAIALRPATAAEYLDRLKMSNDMLGTDYKVEGISKIGAHAGLVTSQQFFPAHAEEASQADVKAILSSQGFVQLKPDNIVHETIKDRTWFHPGAGVVITDAKPKNFIKTPSGQVVPVDVMFAKPEPGGVLHQAVMKNLAAQGFNAASLGTPAGELQAAAESTQRRKDAKTPADAGDYADALADTISPLLKYLRAGLELPAEAQLHYFQRAIAQWPALTKPLQHDTGSVEILTPALVASFVQGVEARSGKQVATPETGEPKTET